MQRYEISNLDSVKYHLSTDYFVFFTGVYVICYGGYHAWSCCINPYVHVSERSQRVWSEWVELCRKDMECVFGRMKKRFRFVKNAIELHNQHQIDNAFFTCCMLHNMILMYDVD